MEGEVLPLDSRCGWVVKLRPIWRAAKEYELEGFEFHRRSAKHTARRAPVDASLIREDARERGEPAPTNRPSTIAGRTRVGAQDPNRQPITKLAFRQRAAPRARVTGKPTARSCP